MKNKNLLIGGAVLLALILFLRNRNATDTNDSRSMDVDGDLGGVGGAEMAKENGGGAVMQTSQPIVVAQPKRKPPKEQAIPRFNNPQSLLAWLKANRPDLLPKTASSTQTQNSLISNSAIQDALNRAQGMNFLTFSGDIENPSILDFGGNIID